MSFELFSIIQSCTQLSSAALLWHCLSPIKCASAYTVLILIAVICLLPKMFTIETCLQTIVFGSKL